LSRRAGPDLGVTVGLSHAFSLGAPVTPTRPTARHRRAEQSYHPGGFNWRFLQSYPEAARLFNAFDYGHAVLYERLLTHDSAAAAPALDREYRYLTEDLLVKPPRFAVAEEAVMPGYAKQAWQAKQMFDWAHVLHRQIYDAYADTRRTAAQQDSLIERLTDYYLSRPGIAFSTVPKSMALMDGQPFSGTFRREHPKFNGLIWAYHWLQVGLYEPLIAGTPGADRRRHMRATVARFRDMVETERYPTAMPMTSAIAPEFSRRHPRAAVIFDNLHMMHDVISDVLASPSILPARKRAAIHAQLAEFRNPSTNVVSMQEWREMADHMGGIDAMGGPPSREGPPREPRDR
jgi:hypothetical protein